MNLKKKSETSWILKMVLSSRGLQFLVMGSLKLIFLMNSPFTFLSLELLLFSYKLKFLLSSIILFFQNFLFCFQFSCNVPLLSLITCVVIISANHCGTSSQVWFPMYLYLHLEKIECCLLLRIAFLLLRFHQRIVFLMLMYVGIFVTCFLPESFQQLGCYIVYYLLDTYKVFHKFQISFQPLVQCLDVDNFIKLFTAVLLERRILLRSNKQLHRLLTLIIVS